MKNITEEQKTQLAQSQNTYFTYLNQQDQIIEQILKRATLNVLQNVDENSSTYHAIGKAYYSQPKQSLQNQLQKEAEEAEKNLKTLEQTKKYVDSKIVESENRLKEQLNQFKE